MKKSRVLLGGADHFKICARKRSRKYVNLCLWTGGCYEKFSPQEASKRIFRYFKEICSIRGAFLLPLRSYFSCTNCWDVMTTQGTLMLWEGKSQGGITGGSRTCLSLSGLVGFIGSWIKPEASRFWFKIIPWEANFVWTLLKPSWAKRSFRDAPWTHLYGPTGLGDGCCTSFTACVHWTHTAVHAQQTAFEEGLQVIWPPVFCLVAAP